MPDATLFALREGLKQCEASNQGNLQENFLCRHEAKKMHCEGHWDSMPECKPEDPPPPPEDPPSIPLEESPIPLEEPPVPLEEPPVPLEEPPIPPKQPTTPEPPPPPPPPLKLSELRAGLNQCDASNPGNLQEGFRCRKRMQNTYCKGHWNRVPECKSAL
jgi:hypothetical protein